MPIIMLTARSTDDDKLLGLELGADDYVTKPFSPRELLALAHGVIERAAGAACCRIILTSAQVEVIAVSSDLRAAKVAVDANDRARTSHRYSGAPCNRQARRSSG